MTILRYMKVIANDLSFETQLDLRMNVLEGIAREMGLNRAFKKLSDLKNFNKTIYLKFKTWIAEAILLVYKTVKFYIKQK